MTRIRKAVFPVAGLGIRFLPATKVIPKEMLPIVDIPQIQVGVQEAVDSGIEEIIFITGRGKVSVVDHFDVSYELEDHLSKRGEDELLNL
ncbi:MAG: sugar phosphate nucleotidyltransferase, partial [bacterium]|nr:sugar phosphate nucleotidyltransferase [bacterium]